MVTCGVRACMVPGHRQLVLRSVAFILRVPPSTQMPLGDRVQGPTGSFTRARALCPNSGVSTCKKKVCLHQYPAKMVAWAASVNIASVPPFRIDLSENMPVML